MIFCNFAGVKFSEVYERALEVIKEEKSSLVDHFTKSCGFVMGIEFKEGSMLINAKTEIPAKKGEYMEFKEGSMLINAKAEIPAKKGEYIECREGSILIFAKTDIPAKKGEYMEFREGSVLIHTKTEIPAKKGEYIERSRWTALCNIDCVMIHSHTRR